MLRVAVPDPALAAKEEGAPQVATRPEVAALAEEAKAESEAGATVKRNRRLRDFLLCFYRIMIQTRYTRISVLS